MTAAEKIYEKLKSAPSGLAEEVLDFVEFLEAKHRRTAAKKDQPLEEFFGVLRDSKAFAGDLVEIQRKLRDEWR
jgi:hypothetical protein